MIKLSKFYIVAMCAALMVTGCAQKKNPSNVEENYYTIVEDGIDYFCTWFENECYLIPVQKCGKTEKNLRLVPTKNGQVKGISFAKDYIAKEVLCR